MTTVYLDNNATTQVSAEVLAAMMPYFGRLYGNPSSMHTFGGQVGIKVREAREQVAALLGASPDEIIFTSCGTESDSTAVLSASSRAISSMISCGLRCFTSSTPFGFFTDRSKVA